MCAERESQIRVPQTLVVFHKVLKEDGRGPVKEMVEGSNPPDSVWSCRVQCETGRSGRRVWMIFGLGLFFDSSSSSVSLSQTWTTTLGVDSVPACSSNFSPVCVKKRRIGQLERF